MISALVTLSWIFLLIIFTKINNILLTIFVILAGATYGVGGDDLELKISIFLLILVAFATYASLTTGNMKIAYIVMGTVNLALFAYIGFLSYHERQDSLASEEAAQYHEERLKTFLSTLPKNYAMYDFESSERFLSFYPKNGLIFDVSNLISTNAEIIIHPFGKVNGKTIVLYNGTENEDYYKTMLSQYKDKSGASILEHYEFIYNEPQDKSDYYVEEFKPYFGSEMNGVSSK